MNTTNKIIIGGTALAIVLVVMFALGVPKEDKEQNGGSSSLADSSGTLVAEESFFDFGTISMAAGNVSHSFKIRNTSDAPITINKMYTSCMCTTATLKKQDKNFGPYGMPGHGFIPSINESIAPGEESEVEVVFDPTAHGPAGVGPIERVVIIETSAGKSGLEIKATVTP